MPEKETHNIPQISHSEYAQEILESAPSSIIRYGSLGIFVIVGLILFLSKLVKYPDIVKGEIIITSINAPQKFKANGSQIIDTIFVTEEQFVRPGDPILIYKSTTDYNQFLELKKSLTKNNPESVHLFERPALGNIQNTYTAYLKRLDDYLFYKDNGHRSSELFQNQNQQSVTTDILNSLYQKKQLKIKELKLSNEKLKKNKVLHENGIISKQELNTLSQSNLQLKSSLEDIKNQIAQTKIQLSNIKKQIITQQSTTELSENNLKTDLETAYNLLKNEVRNWEEQYTITSSIRGFISLSNDISPHVSLTPEQYILSIVPESEEKIIGKVKLPSMNMGKIKKGQMANIKLSSYSYKEFGMIKGNVGNISTIPNNDQMYSIIIHLPQKLITTQTSITYTPEMHGEVGIITEDLSIFDRIFYQIRSIFE